MASQTFTPRRVQLGASAPLPQAGQALAASTTGAPSPRRTYEGPDLTMMPGGAPQEKVTMPRWLIEKQQAQRFAAAGPKVVLVLGAPGAGKRTQCDRICEAFHFTHLNVADLLREELRDPGSAYEAVIKETLESGQLVSGEILVELLFKAMRQDWQHGKYIIDGFPRNGDQLEAWRNAVKEKPEIFMKACIYFDCSEAICVKRLFNEGESGNQMEVILQKHKKFMQDFEPVLNHFRFEGQFTRFDANRSEEQIWAEVQREFIIEEHQDAFSTEAASGSPMKAVWKLRERQCEEMIPSCHSHTHVPSVTGPQARSCTSYTILARHRTKHTRVMHSPRENYIEPLTLSQEIGWHPEPEKPIIKGDAPRRFHPRNTCAMTRHMENMYSTNAQHIIRRW
mmetsp:Transcript_103607/g.195099  ORF Transcript_103607/g.195099 Transcript_103607/m.195099 type:complete len:395 (+) Transcript_103607:110-1294(+)